MKNALILLILVTLFGCTNNGGGVTSEPPAQPIPPPVVQPETPVFNSILSEIFFVDESSNKLNSLAVGSSGKLVFLAKDQFGNKMSGLSFKMGLQYVAGSEDLIPTEVSPGRYEISLNFNFQGDFTGYVKYNDNFVNNYDYMNVSYCNGPATSSPFHAQVTISSKNYFVLCNESQLALIGANSSYMSSNFILGKDINLSNFYQDTNLDNIPDNQFMIGSQSSPYLGTFVGSGYSIKGFKFIDELSDNVGIFSVISNGASIENLTVLNSTILGRDNIGVIGSVLNTSNSTKISSIVVSNSSIMGQNKVGGLIGNVLVSGGSVLVERSLTNINFNFNGTTNNHSRIGGLIGLNIGAEVNENTAFSNYTYTENSFSISKVGGLIGEESSVNNSKVSFSNATATQSYSTGDQIGCLIGFVNQGIVKDTVYGTNCYINQQNSSSILFSGGVFGKIENSLIENVSAFVSANNVNSVFGGMASFINNSQIIKSNVSGSIFTNSSNVGGIVGNAIQTTFSKVSSYVSITVSGGNNSIGGIIGNSQDNTLVKVNNYGTINALNSTIVGGLVGNSVGTIDINNSYNSSNINGLSIVSGIVANTSDNSLKSISNVYNNGNIVGNSFVGGIIGQNNSTELSISNSFSIGKIKNQTNLIPINSGSLIGDTVGSNQSSINNYFLSEATEISLGCSGSGCSSFSMVDTNTVNSLSEDLLYYSSSNNEPMLSWDFNLIWNTYSIYPPYLR